MSFSKEIWGNNIWYLFHSLAHKIREEKFDAHKNNLIFIIKTVCNTLPCPECSKDATAMLDKVDFNNIKNKNDFKILLFNFHNAINAKLNKPMFSYSSLDNKYNNVNFDALYNNIYISTLIWFSIFINLTFKILLCWFTALNIIAYWITKIY